MGLDSVGSGVELVGLGDGAGEPEVVVGSGDVVDVSLGDVAGLGSGLPGPPGSMISGVAPGCGSCKVGGVPGWLPPASSSAATSAIAATATPPVK